MSLIFPKIGWAYARPPLTCIGYTGFDSHSSKLHNFCHFQKWWIVWNAMLRDQNSANGTQEKKERDFASPPTADWLRKLYQMHSNTL